MQFEKAVRTLCDAKVDFIIIGGLSATFHGGTRVTYDLDICYSRSKENLRALAAALAPFHPRPRGFGPDLPFVWDEATLRNATILTLQTDLGEIDLLAEVAGLGDFDRVKVHAIAVEAFGRRIQTLNLRGLIAAKRAAGREKDLADLVELESLLDAGEPE
jgi:predicted nucleotidyltransferase